MVPSNELRNGGKSGVSGSGALFLATLCILVQQLNIEPGAGGAAWVGATG